MALEIFIPKKFKPDKMQMIERVNEVVNEYGEMGYRLTVRQIYYQFVSRDWFPDSWKRKQIGGKLIYHEDGSTNNKQSYQALCVLIADGRLSGYIDMTAVEDRTRERSKNLHFVDPTARIEMAAENYQIDKWEDQKFRPEVWVEKDALEDVVGTICRRLDIPYFSCRGYTSLTAMYENATHLWEFAEAGQTPVILHLGDHDPSGIDMSRDIEERVRMFMNGDFARCGPVGKDGKKKIQRTREGLGDKLIFKRMALNLDQVRQYNPPPNPVKNTDSRYKSYAAEYGEECWELDALDPRVISTLITTFVKKYRDDKKFGALQKREATDVKLLNACASRWDDVREFLETE